MCGAGEIGLHLERLYVNLVCQGQFCCSRTYDRLDPGLLNRLPRTTRQTAQDGHEKPVAPVSHRRGPCSTVILALLYPQGSCLPACALG